MTTEPGCSFEEFKVYYESTELVTDRRIATTRWGYSVCVAIMGVVALLVKLALEREPFFALGLIAAAFVSGIAAIFSYLWLKQIDDYKHLNYAKFKVLNDMAPRVRFVQSDDVGYADEVKSFEPFLREWDTLQQTKSLVEVRSSGVKILALKAGNLERFLPQCFIVLFVIVLGLCLTLGVANLSSFNDSLQCAFRRDAEATTCNE